MCTTRFNIKISEYVSTFLLQIFLLHVSAVDNQLQSVRCIRANRQCKDSASFLMMASHIVRQSDVKSSGVTEFDFLCFFVLSEFRFRKLSWVSVRFRLLVLMP